MSFFICPICKTELHRAEQRLVCAKGHSYDLARQGYVNLLCGTNGRRHGDDKLMVRARTAFLDAGYYLPLAEAITQRVLAFAKNGDILFDAGCGEGYYTSHTRNTLLSHRISVTAGGIDVSRDAILAAASRDRALQLAVASIYDIPVEKDKIDILLNLFAPFDAASFARVMKKNAVLIRAFPDAGHLFSMKCAIYDIPYENKIDSMALEGFTLISEEHIAFPLSLQSRDMIDALFKMTPYYYKTSREGQARLAALSSLDTEAAFVLAVYQKD